jgi:2-polyprenyl-3-methyl-5-hydroxy-6-metoxy-1,4-benzoquinol methylase
MAHSSIPNALVDREKFLVEMCEGRTVLHLGCADFPYTEQSIASGEWLHDRISRVAVRCVGLDLNRESISRLRDQYGIENVIEGDAEHLESSQLGTFDVVLAGEIIEHLNNPGLFLASARNVLAPNGQLIITTTNAFCFRRMIRIPFGTESVHPDHNYYFSHTTLRALASRFDYRLKEAYAYRITNVRPLLPYVVERMATVISSNWGEGIVHVYTV